MYGFTGEQQDATGLVYLRARYYAPSAARFIARDDWPGDPEWTSSYNAWLYAFASPIVRTDPNGRYPVEPPDGETKCGAVYKLGQYGFLDFGVRDGDPGKWTCNELTRALDEMEQLDAAATIGLSQVFGGEVIHVQKAKGARYCGYHHLTGVIELYEPFESPSQCQGTLGHELAHHWDAKWNISPAFATYVGGTIHVSPWFDPWYDPGDEIPPLYGGSDPPNAAEDFAESLAEIVYDQGENERIPPSQKRAQFIGVLLISGRMLEPARPFDVPNYCWELPRLHV
jgi:RHS repeat-associated protein